MRWFRRELSPTDKLAIAMEEIGRLRQQLAAQKPSRDASGRFTSPSVEKAKEMRAGMPGREWRTKLP